MERVAGSAPATKCSSTATSWGRPRAERLRPATCLEDFKEWCLLLRKWKHPTNQSVCNSKRENGTYTVLYLFQEPEKYMPPNCTSPLLRGHAAGCPSVGAGGLGIHGGMGKGGGQAAGPRLCISNPVSEGLGHNIPSFPGRAREYG